jgi:hypothetical protein
MAPLPKDDCLTATDAITNTKQLLCQLFNLYIFQMIMLFCVGFLGLKSVKVAL